ncbi:hypothetical protein [Rubripirellula tenax]|uniref:hypothetical protein n=1 Tax=Rubripirellula tenax TaxID=2528015 RepID=UPI0011B6C4C7|nr:hypothetical protein [Rubripirellula tenax]
MATLSEHPIDDGNPMRAFQPTRSRPRRWCACLRRGPWTIVWAALMMIAGVNASAEQLEYSVGINGHYRVGRWIGIRTPVDAAVTAIETRDGDGVQVRYERSEVAPGETSSYAWTYVIPGSEAAPLVMLAGEDSAGDAAPSYKTLLSARLPTQGSPSDGPAMIPLSMPWVLVLGDPLGIDEIGVNRILDRDGAIAVTRPTSAEAMPNSVLGLDGIDLIVINSSGSELLSQLDDRQRQAIAQWIRDGGKAFLTLGKQSDELLTAAPWLGELLPIDSISTTTIDPAGVETYTSSQSPLQPFVGVRLPKDRGDVMIMGRSTRRVSTPIASRYIVGFGTVVVVAADLESEQFATWPERMDLITRLAGSAIGIEERGKERSGQSTAYNDLAGQTRAVLDQFSIQRRFNFSVLALAMMALVALIGPLDYLLINRVFGKPLLGWLTFPIVAIGLSLLMASQSTIAPPAQAGLAATAQTASTSDGNAGTSTGHETVRCNRIEIVDVDSIAGVGRGYSINYVYTHDASRFDVDISKSPSLQSLAPEALQSRTAPFGYPGESFGGIQISIEDARLPVYDVAFRKQDDRVSSWLRGLPLAPRSSKGFFSDTTFQPKLNDVTVLERRPGSELLQGDLVNPLPFDLLDAKLVFRNWAYLLPTRFRAGERIADVGKLRQKNFRWLLSRQKALESSTETQAWDPSAKNSPTRVAEMLMFHGATGGSQYTNLQNHPLGELDLSDTLNDDQCILYGRLDKPLTTVRLTDANESHDTAAFTPAGDKLTMIRVIMPVIAKTR